jgi:hypothetical protein
MKILVEPLSHIISLTSAIVDDTTQRTIARVGAQFSPRFIGELWSNLTENATEWEMCREVCIL